MATRTAYYAEALSETNATTTPANKASLSYDPADNKNYLYIGSILVQPGTSGSCDVALKNTTDGTTLSTTKIRARDATDYIWVPFVAYEEWGASVSSKTIAIEVTASTGTKPVKEARLCVLELGANDVFAKSTGRSTVTGTTETDKVTLNFTPPSSGDYLLLASGVYDIDSTSGLPKCILEIGGSNVQTFTQDMTDSAANEVKAWATGYISTALSGSQTVKTQFASTASRTTGFAYSYAVALRLADFEDFDYDLDTGRSTSTDTANYADKSSITFTPPAALDYLIIGGQFVDSSTITGSSLTQINGDSTTFGEGTEEPNTTGSGNQMIHFQGIIRELSAASKTFKTQFKPESGTTGSSGSFIIAIQLEASGTTYNDTLSESITVGESLAVVLTANATRSESLSVADSYAAQATIEPAISESFTPGMLLTVGNVMDTTLSESFTPGDSYAQAMTFDLSLSESISPDFSLAAVATLEPAISESITLTESMGAAATMAPALSESISLTDSYTGGMLLNDTLTESLTLDFSPAAQATISAALSEGISLAETCAAGNNMDCTVSYGLTLTDSLLPALEANTVIVEDLSLTDIYADELNPAPEPEPDSLLSFPFPANVATLLQRS